MASIENDYNKQKSEVGTAWDLPPGIQGLVMVYRNRFGILIMNNCISQYSRETEPIENTYSILFVYYETLGHTIT